MKALVYTGPKQLDYRDVADPVAQGTDVLIDLDCSGICGSDMHAFLGHDPRRPAPLILGHEAAGVIASGPEAGRRVTINPLVACGWHAVRLALGHAPEPAERVEAVVLGGGAIGLSAALSLSIQGVSRITVLETNAARRSRMRQALPQFEFQASFEDTSGSLPHLVVDAVGIAPTRKIASAIVRPGGVIAHIGLGDNEGELDVRRMTLQEIGFIGTYTYSAQDFRDTAQAIFEGKFGSFDWVDQRPLSEGAGAFDDLLAGRVDAGKILLMT